MKEPEPKKYIAKVVPYEPGDEAPLEVPFKARPLNPHDPGLDVEWLMWKYAMNDAIAKLNLPRRPLKVEIRKKDSEPSTE